MPVVLGRALDVATLPVFLHQVRRLASRRRSPVFAQIVLVGEHEYREVLRRPAADDLIAERANILETVVVVDVVHEHVRRHHPQAVPGEVSPVVRRTVGEVAGGRTVDDVHFVDVFVDHHRRTVGAFRFGRHVPLAEVIVEELFDDGRLADGRRAQHGDVDALQRQRVYAACECRIHIHCDIPVRQLHAPKPAVAAASAAFNIVVRAVVHRLSSRAQHDMESSALPSTMRDTNITDQILISCHPYLISRNNQFITYSQACVRREAVLPPRRCVFSF